MLPQCTHRALNGEALILLALYEFKQPNFHRAWVTLGRAIRLAKMMGLDRVDGYSKRLYSDKIECLQIFVPLSSPSDDPDELL